MYSTFNNQLNTKEILTGLFLYINKQYCSILAALCLIAFILVSASTSTAMTAFITILLLLTIEIVLMLFLKSNFSKDKIATYTFCDDALEIINSNGIRYCYPYTVIKFVNSKTIILLLFKKNTFAILSKRHMSPEQIKFCTDHFC